MNEYEIAAKKVLPYFRDRYDWPEELISPYGRVPIQIGVSTIWADYVCYISQGQKAVPWLLIEVKQPGDSLDQEAISQAESYSLILDVPFFCVTDGKIFQFYITGNSQGKSIRIQDFPPKPSCEYLKTGVEYISFSSQIDDLIDLFFIGLKNESKFLENTKWHENASKQLFDKVFKQIDSISSYELKNVLKNNVMMKPPNENKIFKQIDSNLIGFKKVLRFIRDFKCDTVIAINQLLDKKGNLYLKGCGIFFITQLLAGAHPNEYVVLEENVSKALKHLKVTDVLIKQDTANGYVYINEICKRLYEEKLKHRLCEYGFGLSAVHNFLWHYYVNYRIKKEW